MAKKKEEMPGIIFDNLDHNPIVDSESSDFYLPFEKDEDFFSIYENETAFYKAVEQLVRTDDFYKKYISYLIEVVGIKECQVMSNIKVEDKSKVKFEMHHGPILTLFDIVMIVTNWYRYHGLPITTFDIADAVLEEHRNNRCRVVLVTKTVHDQIHLDNIVLNMNQGFGDTAAFLEKYKEGVDHDTLNKFKAYIEWSKTNDSFDNGVLRVAETIRCFGENDFPSN